MDLGADRHTAFERLVAAIDRLRGSRVDTVSSVVEAFDAWKTAPEAAPMPEERAREVAEGLRAALVFIRAIRDGRSLVHGERLDSITITAVRAAMYGVQSSDIEQIERIVAKAEDALTAAIGGDVPAGAHRLDAATALFGSGAAAWRADERTATEAADRAEAAAEKAVQLIREAEPRRTFEQEAKAATMAGAADGMRRVLDRMGVPPAGVDAPIDVRKEVVARYGAPRLTPATLTREEARERLLTLGEGPLLLAMPRESLAYYEQLVTMANADHEYAHLRDRWARTVAILRAHVAHLDSKGGAK